MKIVVALDGGKSGEKALEKAFETGILKEAEVILLHVVPKGYKFLSFDAYEKLFEKEAFQEAKKYLSEIAEKYKEAVGTVEIRVTSGNPKLEIPRIADEVKADIIVMGTKGASGVAGAFIGSVAQAVIAQSKVSVLVVPSKD